MKITMQITFTSLIDAALVEEFITNKALKVEMRVDTSSSGMVRPTHGKRKRKCFPSPDTVEAIYKTRDTDETHRQVAERYGLSPSSVGRIRAGKHKLLKKKK